MLLGNIFLATITKIEIFYRDNVRVDDVSEWHLTESTNQTSKNVSQIVNFISNKIILWTV